MYYSYDDPMLRAGMVSLDKDVVKQILEMNKEGEFPEELNSLNAIVEEPVEKDLEFADVTGEIELPREVRRKKRKSRNKRSQNRSQGNKAPTDKNQSDRRGKRPPNRNNRNNKDNNPTKKD